MKRVVIIGGGFTGSRVAKILEKKKNFEVTLIDTKKHFEFTPSILKSITNPKFFNKIKILHESYLKNSTFICGKVKKISKNSISVRGKEIPFDYLVIASGSTYASPIKDQNVSIISKIKHLEEIHDKIEGLDKVVIVGGGAVGVELASELITCYPKKNIRIITSSENLLQRNNEKTRRHARDFLLKKGVKINFNQKVIPNGRKFFLENGKGVEGDYFFLCTGIKNNYEFISNSIKGVLNEKNQLIVNDFLQVKGLKNLFGGGDITNIKEEKTAQAATLHAEVIAKNIIRMEEGKELVKYIPKENPMVLSLGKHHGLLDYKNFSLKGVFPGLLKKLIEKKHLISLKA